MQQDQSQVAVFAIVYGESGMGKSTDMAATFPNALFVGRPGGMQCAQTFLGLKVREMHVRTLEEVIALISMAQKHGHDAIVVDDLSLLAESTERDFDLSGQGSRNKYAKYSHLNGLAAALREQGRYVGIHFAANAHEKPAGRDASGRPRCGGPKLPSWNMGDSVVHEASVVLRARRDHARPHRWKTVYDCGMEEGWVGKDRLTSAAPRSPHNLRAILTAAGYKLSRAPGLEWQDKVVGNVREKLDGGQEQSAVVDALWPKLTGSGLDPRHVAWALRDGFAAHELAAATTDRFRQLFDFDLPSNSAFGA